MGAIQFRSYILGIWLATRNACDVPEYRDNTDLNLIEFKEIPEIIKTSLILIIKLKNALMLIQ